MTDFVAELGCNLFELYKTSGKSFVFSPLSIYEALYLVMSGSTGVTLRELQQHIKLPITDDTIKSFEHLHKILGQNNMIVNKMYFRNDSPVNVSYAKFIQPICEALKTNFDDSFAPQTNEMISKLTHGLINNIVEKPDMQTVMILLNIIYFKEQWKYSFDKSLTRTGVFHSATPRQEKMMHLDEQDLMYYEDDIKQVVELPYKNRLFTMGFILPKQKTNLLTRDIYDVLKNRRLQKETVHVTIPKFESKAKFDLKKAFEMLGMSSMFEPSANFDKMFTKKDNYYISKALHEAVIKVDEEGTEASAATTMYTNSFAIHDTHNFVADHPFVYYIKFNGLTMFLGYFA